MITYMAATTSTAYSCIIHIGICTLYLYETYDQKSSTFVLKEHKGKKKRLLTVAIFLVYNDSYMYKKLQSIMTYNNIYSLSAYLHNFQCNYYCCGLIAYMYNSHTDCLRLFVVFKLVPCRH